MNDLLPDDWSSEPLASGGLRQSEQLAEHLAYRPGNQFHIGQLYGQDCGVDTPAHVLLCGGSRGGKGTKLSGTLLDTEMNLFQFSTKPNEAPRLVHRHGPGNEHCDGMGKKSVVMDTTGNAKGVDAFKAWINPVGGKGGFLDPEGDEFCERADRIAYCVKPPRANENNPYFPDDMRNLISKVAMHVASGPCFEHRDMLTVASLIRQGDVEAEATMMAAEPGSEGAMPRDENGEPLYDAHQLLFLGMIANEAGDGVISEAGRYFMKVYKADEQFLGVLGQAVTGLAWLNGRKMKRLFRGDPENEFRFEEYKTNPDGVACFFAMEETMIETAGAAPRLAFSMLEAALKTPGKTASGRKNLIWLDEFAGLQRLDTVEHGMASIAGYSGGTQLVLIVQSLSQISSQRAYGENGMRTLLAGCTMKVFIDVREDYTPKIVKELLGEKEVVTLQRSITRGRGTHESSAHGVGQSYGDNYGASAGGNLTGGEGLRERRSRSLNRNASTSHQRSANRQDTTGKNESEGASVTESRQVRPVLGVDEIMDRYAVHNPGQHLALVILHGIGPFETELVPYWENPIFYRKYGVDPDHEFVQAPSPLIEQPSTKTLPATVPLLTGTAAVCSAVAIAGAGPIAFVGLLAVPFVRGLMEGMKG